MEKTSEGKFVLAFVGMPGSGKGTCTDFLAEKYKFPVIHLGNMVYDEVARRGLDPVKDEKFVREDMREMEGPNVLAKHAAQVADTLLEAGNNVIVLDGLYSWTEYKYLHEKYGATPEQSQKNREAIAARGAALGFTFNLDKRSRIYNTFDAHRLLHWAEEEGLQPALKKALFKAYFTDGQSPGDHEVLVRVAGEVGLDAAEAREVLASGRYADEVREREQFYLQHGIHSVPAIIVNDRHLIQGGQPVEVFEQALRQIAGQA